MTDTLQTLLDQDQIKQIRAPFARASTRAAGNSSGHCFADDVDAELTGPGVPAGPTTREVIVESSQHAFRRPVGGRVVDQQDFPPDVLCGR